jgi:hypothetical protein
MITITPQLTLARLLLDLDNAYQLDTTDTYLNPAIATFHVCPLCSEISPLNQKCI